MTRRRLLAFVSLAARLGRLSLPSPADAQQPALPRRIGVLLVAASLQSTLAQQFRQRMHRSSDRIRDRRVCQCEMGDAPRRPAEPLAGAVAYGYRESRISRLPNAATTMPAPRSIHRFIARYQFRAPSADRTTATIEYHPVSMRKITTGRINKAVSDQRSGCRVENTLA